jgi:hypothetical protein
MNIYLVRRNNTIPIQHEYDLFICTAFTEHEARHTHPIDNVKWNNKLPYFWVLEKDVDSLRVDLIGVAIDDSTTYVILSSFID